jgi:N-acetylmuramoyl-L-alanine amidase
MEEGKTMKVALDAGHGARPGRPHTGAAANNLIEDVIALDLVKRIGHHLRAAGHETIYTRAGETLVPLAQRTRIAKANRCEMFLSIHCNAGPSSAGGVEAFVTEGDEKSLNIAKGLVSKIVKLGLADRGVKWDNHSQHPRLAVLRGTYRQMPAILLEVGFLTNSHDAALLQDARWREQLAISIAIAVK